MSTARGWPEDWPARAPDDGHDHAWRKVKDGNQLPSGLPILQCELCFTVWPRYEPPQE